MADIFDTISSGSGDIFDQVSSSKGRSLKRGERSFIGNIFERPGAAIRSGLMNIGKEGGFVGGYAKGAAAPEEVPTFQSLALEKYYGEGKPSALKTAGGFGVSTAGLAGDILTNPADLLALIVGKTPTGGGVSLAGRVGATKAGQAVSRFINMPVQKTLPVRAIGKSLKAISEAPSSVAKGTVRALIPYERITERGLGPRGFRSMLKPEYYQERIPQDIMKKGVSFFDDARTLAGEEISNTINTKYSNVYTDMKLIQNEARNILGKGISLKDLDISPAQYKLLQRETNKVLNIKGKPISISNLWETRKSLDKVIYDTGFSWKPDALRYLKKLRGILNKPIKSAGKDIEQSFNKYTDIENTFDKIGKSFEGIINRQTGEISSPDFATFINNLMSDSARMPEIRNLLSKVNPEFSETLFDLASAKKLGLPLKDPLQRGFWQAMLYPLQRVLHPKNVATVVSKFQRRPVSLKAGVK